MTTGEWSAHLLWMQAARARALPVRDAQGGLPELRREGGTGAVGGRKEPSDEGLRLVPRRLGQADGLERRDAGAKRLLWIGKKRTLKTRLGFFRWFGPKRSQALRFICSDMWKAYLRVVNWICPLPPIAPRAVRSTRHRQPALAAPWAPPPCLNRRVALWPCE
jgi:hypothetical protein